METAKPKRGRPLKWDAEMAAAICERLASTNESLPDVLAYLRKRKQKVPCVSLFYRWRAQKADFREALKVAREQQSELDIDEAYRVARTSCLCEMTTVKREKGRVVETITRTVDNVERSKLLVQTLFRRAALFNPARFGDKIDLAVAGEVAVKRVVLDPKWRRAGA